MARIDPDAWMNVCAHTHLIHPPHPYTRAPGGHQPSHTAHPHTPKHLQDNVCKQTVKDLLTCANTEEYDSATGDWKAPNTCVDKYKATFEKCKGASIEYENKVAASGVDANQVARPSYAVAGTLSKVHAFQALVAIPAEDQKVCVCSYMCMAGMGWDVMGHAPTRRSGSHHRGPHTEHNYTTQLRGVSCAICSKFTKKLLECALPATPTGGQTPLQAYRTAAFACLTSNWDQVLYE